MPLFGPSYNRPSFAEMYIMGKEHIGSQSPLSDSLAEAHRSCFLCLSRCWGGGRSPVGRDNDNLGDWTVRVLVFLFPYQGSSCDALSSSSSTVGHGVAFVVAGGFALPAWGMERNDCFSCPRGFSHSTMWPFFLFSWHIRPHACASLLLASLRIFLLFKFFLKNSACFFHEWIHSFIKGKP